MKSNLLVLFILVNYTTDLYSAELALFNSDVLRKNVETSNTIVTINQQNDRSEIVYPKYIHTDISKGKYVAATVYYSVNDTDMNQLRIAINSKYPNSEYAKISKKDYRVWRIENEKLTITLTENNYCDEKYIIGTYMVWF